jgi:hypothetical protein
VGFESFKLSFGQKYHYWTLREQLRAVVCETAKIDSQHTPNGGPVFSLTLALGPIVCKEGHGYILHISLGVPMPLFVTNGSTVMEKTGPPTAGEMVGFGSNGGESAVVSPFSGARKSQQSI